MARRLAAIRAFSSARAGMSRAGSPVTRRMGGRSGERWASGASACCSGLVVGANILPDLGRAVLTCPGSKALLWYACVQIPGTQATEAMMDLNSVVEVAGGGHEILGDCWAQSEACYPEGGPRFLHPAEITKARAFAGLPDEADAALHAAAQRIREIPELAHLAWHCSQVVFENLEYSAAKLREWPDMIGALGELAGVFYFLVGLDAVGRTRETHSRLGIPEGVTRDCFSQYSESMRYNAMQGGNPHGVRPRTLYWLRNHIKGDLFRLGRMEYMLKPFTGKLQAWRHRQSGKVVALALAGESFDAEGLMTRTEPPDTWLSRLVDDGAAVTGSPISPLGYAQRPEVTLPHEEWQLVLSPGDTILEMHIPDGGGMTPERCHDSMRQALEFFLRHFPERSFAGFACGSWILNPELDRIYRADSNMVLWQRELYLFPIWAGRRCGVYFIFGEDNPDPATAPRETSLQRALLDQMAADGRLIGGGMFLLTEDFAAPGSQVYRRQWGQ